MKLNISFLAILILIAIGSVTAQNGVQAITVFEAVRIALDNNLSLTRSAIDVQTRQRTAGRSWNGLIPQVSASAGASHATSLIGDIAPARDGWNIGPSLSAGLTLSTSIIDNIKKAQADYELGLLTYEAARQELELQVRKLFYQILLLDANRELAVQNFASAQARYEQSAALVRVGQAPRLDELSARVDMENMRPAVRNAGMLYENALDSFIAILGFPADTVISLDGSLSVDPPENLSAGNLETGESLEAASVRKSIQSMESQLKAIRNGAYVPSLRLSWNAAPSYDIQSGDWSDNGSFSVSLGLNIETFLPWSSAKTQMDNLNDSIRSAQIQLSDTMRSRENRVSQNLRNVERIAEALQAMRLNVDLAQSTYEMYQDAYRRGAADYQQLRGAGDSLEQTLNRLLQEEYNLISALLDLEKELNIPFGTLFVGE
jgi:outer membrane protein TolC